MANANNALLDLVAAATEALGKFGDLHQPVNGTECHSGEGWFFCQCEKAKAIKKFEAAIRKAEKAI